ncbi:MAG: beta-N-acetylhexosaminidase [Anaerolineae bacterium]|nr:beta-N-acetylhexosaminidase [Anaerolineae bacterium]
MSRVAFLVLALLLVVYPDLSAQAPAMSLEHKVAQLFLVPLYGPNLNEPGREFLREWQPGGVVIFPTNTGDPVEMTALINTWQQTVTDAGGVPMFIGVDQEGGMIARLREGFTEFPVPMLLTASGNVDLAYRVGGALGNELRAVGVNLNLAPVADLYTNLRNPVIGRRSFGSDPERTGRMLAALIRGMQAGGVMATAKHFPGHGDTEHDSHTTLPIVSYPRDELERVEFAPFRWTIAAGVESMMIAHIWYPALDPDDTLPASLSYNVITDLLRRQMGFQGLVMTDALEMDAIDTTYGYGEAAIRAIHAGVDLIAVGAHMNPNTVAQTMQAVVDAVRNGEILEARIDQSVARILDAKQRYGILDWQPLDPSTAPLRIRTTEHAMLIEEIFREGTTIAYDHGDKLPLRGDQTLSILYTRPSVRRYCGTLHPPELTRWVTVDLSPTDNQISSAIAEARRSDTVIVFTENAATDPAQQRLVNALPAHKTIAVALFSPYDWQAFPEVAAYLTTYSPMEPAIPAVCGILFGQIPARGQLPVALDGSRDFAAFLEREGLTVNTEGIVIAMAARETVTPLPTLTALPPTPLITATPWPTFTPTETFAPLISSTRVAIAPPPQVESIAIPDQALVDATVSPLPIAFLGMIGLAVMSYGGLYWIARRGLRRYGQGFILQRCPACKQGKLELQLTTRTLLGITWVQKRIVECDHCHSRLREVSPRRWKYTINAAVNADLHRRFHNKVIDEGALRVLDHER